MVGVGGEAGRMGRGVQKGRQAPWNKSCEGVAEKSARKNKKREENAAAEGKENSL